MTVALLVDPRGSVFSCLLQFLCLKNIRTFLKVCHDKFGLRNSELFDPFDLFDVRDFGKVSTLFSRVRAEGAEPWLSAGGPDGTGLAPPTWPCPAPAGGDALQSGGRVGGGG